MPPSAKSKKPMHTCDLKFCGRSFETKSALAVHLRTCTVQEATRIQDHLYEKEQRKRRKTEARVQQDASQPVKVQKSVKPWEIPDVLGRGEEKSNSRRRQPAPLAPTFLEGFSNTPSDPLPVEDRTAQSQPGPDASQSSQPPPIGVDAFKTEFHPHSKRSTRVESFDNYGKEDARERKGKRKAHPTTDTPWEPFQTRADFEFADIALASALTRTQIERLLQLMTRCIEKEEQFTLKDFEDVSSRWEAAARNHTRFAKIEIPIAFDTMSQTVDFWYRDIWACVVEWIEDPLLAEHFRWDAVRIYKYDGKQFVRFVDEPWTANRFWEFQSLLPDNPEAKPLGLILYADTTKLSSFGTEKGHPIILRCANLVSEIRNSDGIGGGIVVGWLPIIEVSEGDKGKTQSANFKRVSWHSCFIKLLEAISRQSVDGQHIHCGDDIIRRLYPFIVILAADYEEQAVMALIRGINSLFPCPICLVPDESLGDMLHAPWPKRDMETTKQLVRQYTSAGTKKDIKRADEQLKKQGLRGIENAFWTVAFSDPFKALSWDRMHNYALGLGGKHIYPLISKYIKTVSKDAANTVDAQVSALPRWQGLYHPTKVVTVEFSDAKKFEDLMRLLLFVAHNVMYDNGGEGSCLLELLRAYQWLDFYASLDVHTEKTIALGEAALQTYAVSLNKYKAIGLDSKGWDFPKNHIHRHMFEDIISKGVTKNYNTKYDEAMHTSLKESYQFRGHFRNVADYVRSTQLYLCCSKHIKRNIETMDGAIAAALDSKPDTDYEGEDEESPTKKKAYRAPISIANVYLGAAQKPITINELQQSSSQWSCPAFFSQFLQNLQAFLNHHQAMFGQTVAHINGSTKITEYRYLKIQYESMVTWKTETDYLRCSPNFNKAPRYDCVMINSGTHIPDFAQLRLLFSFTVNNTPHLIAVVQYLDARPKVTPRTRTKDNSLQLIRLRKKNTLDFIVIRSIIRGVPLFPAFDHPDDFMVFDMIDQDMGLRAKELYENLCSA
ncbi:hypothetical protein CVT24_008300 [Panaeolus cyanescens]|uniref:C2H2-type domain-containing protein n=1 Tax=Panaeolus cyanescens TaxID=181874 RepID=A0A409WWH5_9AGAR|nr:hypothetical protein CVT24_008300 [Panaeolus cyanescens]